MPIYEYQCKACGHALEVIQKVSEEPLKFCPECGQPELNKLVSAAGFRLKGSGWYETDFKSGDKKKNLAGDSKPTAASSSDSAKASGDAKPAAPAAAPKAPAASS
ncbi:MAG: FmdB family zinc ribbon protein [Candidatus Methylumidiphilus sp.]